MDSDRLDALSRALDAARSRRGALAVALGGLGSLLGLVGVEAGKNGKKKKKRKKKNPYNPSGAYNTCLAEVSLLCGMAGCASREQSPGCAACYADVEACCQQALIAKGAECACINTLPGFVCFGG